MRAALARGLSRCMRYPGYAYGAATDARTTEATERREAKYKCSEPELGPALLDDRPGGVRII